MPRVEGYPQTGNVIPFPSAVQTSSNDASKSPDDVIAQIDEATRDLLVAARSIRVLVATAREQCGLPWVES